MANTKETPPSAPPTAESQAGSGGFASGATCDDLRAAAYNAELGESSTYSAEEAKKFAGDLKPNQVGWVLLGEDGEPTGAATLKQPEPGKAAARVIISGGEIATTTGAPITKHMNPYPDPYDEGMKQRNPVPGNPQEPTMKSEHPKAQQPPPAAKK